MKRWIHAFGVVLTVGSFSFFGAYLWRYRDQWPEFELGPASWATIGGLLLFQIGVAVASALAWREIVGFSGAKILNPRRAISIFCQSQFAKYIPGNVAHHIGRVVLAKSEGLSAKRATLSQTIEALWNLGCAAVLAVFGLSQLIATENDAARYLFQPWAIAVFAAIALLGPVAAFPLCIQFLKRRFPERLSADARIQISPVRSLGCMAAYLLSFLYLGVAMNGLASGVFGLQPLDLGFISSVCALAWVAGFVTPGSPAGIGIRDTILLLALQPYYGEEAAAALTLSHRVLTAFGDAFVFGFGIALGLRK